MKLFKLKKLNQQQRQIMSGFFSNMAVAVLTTSAIVPFFSQPKLEIKLLAYAAAGVSITSLFLAFSIIMMSRRK